MTITLVILTIISLVIDALVYTAMLYGEETFYNVTAIRSVINSGWFMTLIWIDNIAIYIINLLYFAGVLDFKRDLIVKIYFDIFSILSMILINIQIVNLIVSAFEIF